MTDPKQDRIAELIAKYGTEEPESPGQPEIPEVEPPKERTPPPTSKREPDDRPARGLLDLIVVAMAVYTMTVSTPVGGLIVRGFNWVLGSRVKTKPLIGYFQTGEGNSTPGAKVKDLLEAPNVDAETTRIATRVGLSPDMARAAAIMTSGGQRDAQGRYDVKFPGGVRTSFPEVGVTVPAETAPAAEREEKLIEGLAKLTARLGSAEAAAAAMAVDITHVEYATSRAKAAEVPQPLSYRRFRPFLPPEHRDEADTLVNGIFALTIAFDLHWPVREDARVSSPFGWRTHPVLGTRKLHKGTDFAIRTGTDMWAIADGRVRYAINDAINGKFIKIDHGFGLTSAYCHSSELKVDKGDEVKKGDLVALSGATGRVTGPHLHFQLELAGEPIDVELFKKTRTSTTSY